MASQPAPHEELLDLAVAVAHETAELVRERRRDGVEVAETKSSPVDVVTAVDTAAEELIYQRLMTARPRDGFLGEEGSASTSETGVTWIVDPIDGTVNFLYGIPQYAVSIAAAVEGDVVAGVVVDVVGDATYTATLGGGAACDGRPLRVRARAPLAERLVLTGFSYVADVRARQAAALGRMITQVRDVRRFGSAALDLCSIGAGRADAYVEEGLNPWDLAAGGLVAREAGAVLAKAPGIGGREAVICAPSDGYEEFADLVERCGFLAENGRPKRE